MNHLQVVLNKIKTAGVVLSPIKCILELDKLNTWVMYKKQDR